MALFARSKPGPDIKPSAATAPAAAPDAALAQPVRAVGLELLSAARQQRGGVLSKAFWSGKLIDWAMKDEAFKVQLFRFVDAYPALRSADQVYDLLTDYLSQPGVTPPPGFGLGVK